MPNTSQWVGAVPHYTPPTGAPNVWRFLLSVPTGGDTNNATLVSLYNSGSVNRVDVVYGTSSSGSLELAGYDSALANQLFASGFINFGGLERPTRSYRGRAHLRRLHGGLAYQRAVRRRIRPDRAQRAGGLRLNVLGRASTVVVNLGQVQDRLRPFGQISVQDFYAPMDSPSSPDAR